MLRHGSLFSGIGGFDLAASWMGWQNVFSCEIDMFCRNILNHYWPKNEHHADIYQLNAAQYRGRVDIISGGFPCQPFSHAGRRKGKADDRYLWPQTLRIITEARPKWIVLENVAGLFSILEPESLSKVEIKEIELFCADDKQRANKTIVRLQRRIIGSIVSEIESAGYILPRLQDGTPIILCIPACAVDAPHRRDRVWFVAHAEHIADREAYHRCKDTGSHGKYDERRHATATWRKGRHPVHGGTDRADPSDKIQRKRQDHCTVQSAEKPDGNPIYFDPPKDYGNVFESTGLRIQNNGFDRKCQEIPNWDEWPNQPPVCRRDDGISTKLDGITFPTWREKSLKAYGNAIVPQVALELFRAIEIVERGEEGSLF